MKLIKEKKEEKGSDEVERGGEGRWGEGRRQQGRKGTESKRKKEQKYGDWRKGTTLSKVEKAMAPHSSTLAWKTPRMEEPGGLQSRGLLRVGHDWATHFHFSLSCIGEGNGHPLQCSCLENPRDGGAWWAAVYGVAQSRTRLKRLSSSSSSK